MSVWLLKDDYDYNDDPTVISATTLLQPMRALVLKMQNKEALKEVDIKDLVASKLGTAIHDSLEAAWSDEENVFDAFDTLGMGSLKPRLLINPKDEDLKPDTIAIYMENRVVKQIGKWKVSGKYDLILDGTLHDYKSTSVYAIIFNSNGAQYTKQGSIYKWLNPDKITDSNMKIEYLFTDWSSQKAKQDANYPDQRVESKRYPLMSIEATEAMITQILADLDLYKDMEQVHLPECTPEELWQKPTTWKYYKKPGAKRSTANFPDDMAGAYARKDADGNTGEVIEFPGEVKRCNYCPCIDICTQAQLLIGAGLLKSL